MIKLIASDMDGTLLNDFWRISDENIQAIKRAQELGIQFMVATGRPYNNVHVITEKAGISCAVVGLNGATTHDEHGVLMSEQALKKQEVEQIIAILKEHHIYIELMTNKGSFSVDYAELKKITYALGERELSHLSIEERTSRIEMLNEERIRNENCQFISSFQDILNDESITIYKVFSMSTDDDKLEKAAEQLKALNMFAVTSAGHLNLEVNAIHGHKGHAVFEYAAIKGIKPEEVMTIGDNFNDLTMLLKAGRGVAMGNAHPKIKEQCRYTTKTNLESGVAHAIHQMLAQYKAQ